MARETTTRAPLWDVVFRERDAAALVAFRVLLGVLISVSALRFLTNGWVERFFVKPTYFFKYWGFEWVEVLSPEAMHAAFVALVVLGGLITLGLLYRVASLATFLIFTYVELIDVTNYLNHYYLMTVLTLLAAALPLHRCGSVDAWISARRRGTAMPALLMPAWVTWLLRFQVGVVWFYAGIAKMNADWLLHGQPMGIWMASRTDTPILGALFAEPSTAIAMSWAGCFYDTFIAGFLLVRRTRPWAMMTVVIFHSAVGYLFNIGMFPVIMIACATVFLDPSWPRRLIPGSARPDPRPAQAVFSPIRVLGVAMVGLFVSIQLLVPARAALYPGSVSWHEQGMRWSWRVMTREKAGSITYRVTLPGDTRERIVSPRRYLTAYQEREMSGQPDLILQLGQHIADDYRQRGLGEVEVRVDAPVSLNGRPPSLLIDPDVDLSTITPGMGRAD
ncbi:MAG: HTTM domain-containing protein, partial [Myxococcota bacterium]|nr:HTTM domain-containing protein [Myxococcota bacterium]